MNKNIINQYRINDEKETYLWNNAIFVFDSSSLLDLYFVPKNSREKIYEEIFKKLENRLWLPFHVQYEFLKNREKIIIKPISEKYNPLKTKIQTIGSSIKNEISKKIDEISRETHKDDKHPHIEQKEIEDFKKNIETFTSEFKKFEENIIANIANIETEIKNVESDDDVLKSLETYFEIGREFSFEEILEITKEGKHRYEFKIPPGYGDFYKKEKIGTQIFGDLIIWKQILEYSKEKKLPIIYITNDIKKDNDWCHLDLKATEDRIYSPREELIKEIKDYSAVDFWMYNLPQFLFNSNKYVKSTIKEETIQNISQFLNNNNSKKGNYLKFKCNNCGTFHKYDKDEFDLDFDCVGGSERSMGTENQYEAIENFKCNCGNNITAKFEVWEYPVGIHNYDSIELDGAKLIESFYFTVDFYDDEEDIDFCTCEECSGNKDEMGNGVSFYNSIDISNEYDNKHPNHKYKNAISGNCDWCNTLHIKCPKCDCVNSFSEYKNNQNVECEGGCGLIFNKDTNDDFDNLGEYNLQIIDHRKNKCSNCGENFIDKNGVEICEDCEEKYNEE